MKSLFAFNIALSVALLTAVGAHAQERFFASPDRHTSDGARKQLQLQQETTRNINQAVSLTQLAADISTSQAAIDVSLSSLTAAVNVSLSTAGDLSCGNAGMIMGPSHTIAVGKCIPSLTITPQGHTFLTGGVRLGSVGNCDASLEGTLRYQQAAKTVQFCDGNSWQEVGAAPVSSGNFTAQTNLERNTVVTSNNITVSGFAGARTATVTPGATIVVNGTPIGAAATVNSGDTVALRVSSAATFDTTVNVTFTLSSLVSTWTVQTRTQDTAPNAFTFAAVSNAELSTQVMSANVNPTGFDGPLTVSVAGTGSPALQVNGGSWVSSASINPGDTVRLRLTSSSAFVTSHAASVTLGSYTTNWQVTTKSDGCGAVAQANALQFQAYMATAQFGDWWGNGGSAWMSFPAAWGTIRINQNIPAGPENSTVVVNATKLSGPTCASGNGVWNACSSWCATSAFQVQLQCDSATKRWILSPRLQAYYGPLDYGCTALSSTSPNFYVEDQYNWRHDGYSFLSPWGTTRYVSP